VLPPFVVHTTAPLNVSGAGEARATDDEAAASFNELGNGRVAVATRHGNLLAWIGSARDHPAADYFG
jgi:hypothetical protein